MANDSFDHLYPIDIEILEKWISETSEGILHDFKQEIDVTDKKKKCEFIRDMISLANMAWIEETPSYLIIGVSNKGDIIGLNKKFKDEANYQEIIRSSVTPKIDFVVRKIKLHEKTLGVLVIRSSSSTTPYVVKKSIYSNQDRLELQEGQSWLRSGSGKYKITTQELLELAASYREKKFIYESDINFDNPIVVDFINYQETFIDTNIYSLSTREEVPYVPLKIEIQDEANLNQKKIYDAVEWSEQSDSNVLIIGQPGQGKTSLLKHLFIRRISEFRSKNEIRLPIFVKSVNFKSYDQRIEWLSKKNDSNHEFWKMIEKGIYGGRFLIFVDAWDELTPSKRIELEKYLKDLIQKNNRITITSRAIPDNELPKLVKSEKEEIRGSTLLKGLIKPLEKDQIPKFLVSRRKNWSKTKIRGFISVFLRSSLENIPLWLDLLSFPMEIQQDEELNEILILSNWVNQIINRDQGQIIHENIAQVEKLAFYHFRVWDKEPLTHYFIQDTVKVSLPIFSALKKVGWLITSNYEYTEPIFEFVHHRLAEYLAARYICRHWNEITDTVFDRRNGILCQPNKEVIIELAISEAIRRKYKENEIIKRIYQITGEDGWDFHTDDTKPYQGDKLRDPFLSSYLLEICGLQPKLIPWHNNIDTFLGDVFEKYDRESPYEGWRSWIDSKHMIRGMLARIPERLSHSKNSFHLIESTILETNLTDAVIDRNLELLSSIEVLEQHKYVNRFNNLISRRSTSGKWQEVIIEYVKYEIQKTPCSFYLMFLLDKVEDTKKVEELYLSWSNSKDPSIRANCLEMFSPILKNNKTAQEIIDRLIEDEEHDVQYLAASLLNSHDELLTKNNLKSWLKSRDPEIRKLALRSSNSNVRDLLYSLESELSDLLKEKDLEILIKMHYFDFTKPEWSFLLSWFCKNKPLSQLIHMTRNFSKGKDFDIILQKIALFIEEPIDEATAIKTLQVLPFNSKVVLSFSKKYLLTASKELKLFIEKNKIFKDISKGKDIQEDKLYSILSIDPEFLDDLMYILAGETKNSDEIISTAIKGFIKLKKSPIQLLDWVVRNPIWLTLEWLNDLISLEKENSGSVLFHYLIQFNRELVRKGKMSEFITFFFDLAVNDKNRNFITIGAACCDFLPFNERKKFLEVMSQHSSTNIRAISLRMIAEDLGINVKRVMQKAKICIDSKMSRPVYQRLDVLDQKGLVGLIDFNIKRRKRKEEVNFGLINNENLLDAKGFYHTIHFTTFLAPIIFKQEPIIQDWKDFSSKPLSYRSKLKIWRIPLKKSSKEVYSFGKRHNEQLLLNDLLDSDDSIVLTTLFYFEEILIFSSDLFDKQEVQFSPIFVETLNQLETHSNSLIKGMAKVVLLGSTTEREKLNYIQDNEFDIHSLQAYLWVCGGERNIELDCGLANYLENLSLKEIIQSLPIMVPWIIAFPKSYKMMWKQLASLNISALNNNLFEEIVPNFVFYFFYRTLLLSNEINAFYLAKNGMPMSYPLVDDFYRSIGSQIIWAASEIDELSSTLVSHQHEALYTLGKIIRLSLGYDSINLKEIDFSKFSKSEAVFLKIYHQHLPLFDKKECYHRLLQIGDVHDKIWVVKQLQTLPITTDLLLYLQLLIQIPEEEFQEMQWFSENEVTKLWEKLIPILIQKHFEIIVKDFYLLLDSFPLNFLPRAVLEELLNWFSNEEGEVPQRLVNRLFQLLYPKLWYSYNTFWQDVLFDE